MGKKKKNEISEIPTGKNLLSGRFFNDEKKNSNFDSFPTIERNKNFQTLGRFLPRCNKYSPAYAVGIFCAKTSDITKKIETKIKNRFIVFVLNLFE